MQAVLPGTSSLQVSDYTLHSAYDLVVPAHGKALVRTDCAASAPPGFRLGVFALPGFAWVHHVSVSAASTDRCGVAVVLFNHSDTPLDIAAGAAIALLVLERVGALVVQEVQQLPKEVPGHLRLTKCQSAPLVPKSVAGVAPVLLDLRSDDALALTNKETE